MSRTALIVGVTGQDGAYLARLLLNKGYKVFGTSRDAEVARTVGLAALGVADRIALQSLSPVDFRSMFTVVTRCEPDEIYNLAGQSSVGLSFTQPVETMESIAIATLNILESVRLVNPAIRVYNAGSSECFGDTGSEAATERTAFRPRSPYGVAKTAACNLVSNYREAYGLHCSSGILFNHESPLRPQRFVTKKIVAAAVRIAAGSTERLALGHLTIARDWGWAPEYVQAMWLMLQQDRADDFVIATGESHTLQEFVATAFAEAGLAWRDHVVIDPGLARPSEIAASWGNAAKAERVLCWKAGTRFADVIKRLVAAERDELTRTA